MNFQHLAGLALETRDFQAKIQETYGDVPNARLGIFSRYARSSNDES